MAAAIEAFHKVLTGAFISVSWTCATDLTQPGGKTSDSRRLKRPDVSCTVLHARWPMCSVIFFRHVCPGETLCDISFIAFFSNWRVSTRTKKRSAEIDLQPHIFFYNVFSHILSKKKKKKVNSCFSVSTARLLGDVQENKHRAHTHTHAVYSVITGLLQSTGCCVTSAPPHNKENGRVTPDKRRRSRDSGGDNRKDRIGSLEMQPWLCRFPAETIHWGGFHFYNCQ